MGTIAKLTIALLLLSFCCFAQQSSRRKLIAPRPAAGDSFPSSGLMAYWRFDEGTPNKRYDVLNPVGNYNFYESGTITTNAGIIGPAAVIPGTYEGDGLTMNDAPAATDVRSTFTFGLWAYLNALTFTRDAIIASHHQDVIGNMGWQMARETASSNITFNYSTNGSPPWIKASIKPNPALASNTWHLITVGVDTNTAKIFVSYDLQRATNSAIISTVADTYRLGLNAYLGMISSNYLAAGRVDEGFFYNRILTDAELALIYNSGSGRRP